ANRQGGRIIVLPPPRLGCITPPVSWCVRAVLQQPRPPGLHPVARSPGPARHRSETANRDRTTTDSAESPALCSSLESTRRETTATKCWSLSWPALGRPPSPPVALADPVGLAAPPAQPGRVARGSRSAVESASVGTLHRFRVPETTHIH